MLKTNPIVFTVGIIEILIGGITFTANLILLAFSSNPKSFSVLIFIFVTAIMSSLLGYGLLKRSRTAYQLLLYFSSVIVLSKILIFMNIIQLNGALETTMPSSIKNALSIIYHGALIYYLTHHSVREIFGPNEFESVTASEDSIW